MTSPRKCTSLINIFLDVVVNGCILWVSPFRHSHRVKCRGSTKNIAVCAVACVLQQGAVSYSVVYVTSQHTGKRIHVKRVFSRVTKNVASTVSTKSVHNALVRQK